MRKLLLFIVLLNGVFFSSSAFSLYEYDYCNEIYESAGQFRGINYSPDLDELKEISELLAVTYAYRNNADDPDKLAKEASDSVALPIGMAYLESMKTYNNDRPQVTFVSKCIQALR